MDETPEIRNLRENHYILDGKVLVSELNQLLGIELNEEEVDTIGGWILTQNYEAKQGDSIGFSEYVFHIKQMEDHHIKLVEVTKKQSIPSDKRETLPLLQTNKAIS